MSKEKKNQDFILLNTASFGEHLFAIFIFTALASLLRLKLLSDPTLYYLGGSHSDAGLYLWLFRHHLTHFSTLPYFETTSFFPYPLSLAWSDSYLFPALIAYPFTLAGLSTPVLYNLILLGAFIGLGYCTFRVTFLISGDSIASLAAGCASLFLSYTTHSLGHPQLQFVLCFPIAIEILLRSLRSPVRSGVFFALLFIATFFTTVYYAVFLTLFPVAFFATLVATRPKRETILLAGKFAIGAVLLSPALFFLASPYFSVKEIFGARELTEMYAFRATGLSFVSAPPLSLLYSFTSSFTHAEAHFFSGILLSVFVVIPYFHIQSAPQLKRYALSFPLLALSIFLFSTPSFYSLLSLPTIISKLGTAYFVPFLSYASVGVLAVLFYKVGKLERFLKVEYITNRVIFCLLFSIFYLFILVSLGPTASTDAPQLSLFSLFYSFVPGFDATRAISRAAFPSLICLCIFFGLAIWQLKRWNVKIYRLVPLALLVVFIENYNTNYALEPRDGAPSVLETLRKERESQDVVLFLPMTDAVKPNKTVKSWRNFALRNVNFMNWSLDYELPTVNGYSGQRTKIMKELPGRTSSFPDAESLTAISKIANVRYIVFETRHQPNFDHTYFQAQYEYYSPALELVQKGDEGYYLFRFNGENRFTSRDFIRAPVRTPLRQNTEAQLSFNVRPPYEGEGKEISIEVSELDHADGAVFNTTLPANGEWQTLSFPLPKQKVEGLPFRFQFSSENTRRLFLKEVSVVSKTQNKLEEEG